MTRCSGCCKWLDLQSDSVAMDEGTLCQECFTEWYPETADLLIESGRIIEVNGVYVGADTTTLDDIDVIKAGGTLAEIK